MANSEMLLNRIIWEQVLTRGHRNCLDYRKCKFTHSTHCFMPEITYCYLKKKKKSKLLY